MAPGRVFGVPGDAPNTAPKLVPKAVPEGVPRGVFLAWCPSRFGSFWAPFLPYWGGAHRLGHHDSGTASGIALGTALGTDSGTMFESRFGFHFGCHSGVSGWVHRWGVGGAVLKKNVEKKLGTNFQRSIFSDTPWELGRGAAELRRRGRVAGPFLAF